MSSASTTSVSIPTSSPTIPPTLTAGRLALTVAGLLLTLLLAALDATIVATAMPRILAELGGQAALGRYTWLATAYLLASTVTVPIVGKLADQFGRRPFLVGGTLLFLAASLLCSLAGSLEQLVAFRGLQGVGGGLITAAVFAAVPTLFSPANRARIVGLFTGTYGLASIVGPLLGGVVTDGLGWRWVFALNLPLGLVALLVLLATYPGGRSSSGRPAVDYLGALCLIGGVSPLLVALSLGGHELAWESPPIVLLLLAGALALAAFAWAEHRAPEPMIPLALLGNRAVGIPALGMAFMAVGLFAASLFTPLFVQGVVGQSATRSGSVLAPMMLAWVLASVLSGQLIARIGRSRPTGVAGLAVGAVGLWLMAGMGPQTEYPVVARNLVVIGFGLGSAVAAFATAAQNAVRLDQTGVATALGTFARAMGSTLASAGLGGLLAASLATSSAAAGSGLPAALRATFVASAVVLAIGAAIALFAGEPPRSRA